MNYNKKTCFDIRKYRMVLYNCYKLKNRYHIKKSKP